MRLFYSKSRALVNLEQKFLAWPLEDRHRACLATVSGCCIYFLPMVILKVSVGLVMNLSTRPILAPSTFWTTRVSYTAHESCVLMLRSNEFFELNVPEPKLFLPYCGVKKSIFSTKTVARGVSVQYTL